MVHVLLASQALLSMVASVQLNVAMEHTSTQKHYFHHAAHALLTVLTVIQATLATPVQHHLLKLSVRNQQ